MKHTWWRGNFDAIYAALMSPIGLSPDWISDVGLLTDLSMTLPPKFTVVVIISCCSYDL